MKTLLVDDHALFREGLGLLMTHGFPDITLLQAGSLAEALALLAEHPDVALTLLDLNLPDAQGLEGLARVQAFAPDTTVVVLSADESPGTVLAAIDGGAAGFVPKTARAGVMKAALNVVLAGGVYLPPEVLGHARPAAEPVVMAISDTPDDDDAAGLSPRQMDVLRLLVGGKANKVICRELDLSESTVKTHLAAIFRKLDVSSRTQAVVAAARLGLRFSPR